MWKGKNSMRRIKFDWMCAGKRRHYVCVDMVIDSQTRYIQIGTTSYVRSYMSNVHFDLVPNTSVVISVHLLWMEWKISLHQSPDCLRSDRDDAVNTFLFRFFVSFARSPSTWPPSLSFRHFNTRRCNTHSKMANARWVFLFFSVLFSVGFDSELILHVERLVILWFRFLLNRYRLCQPKRMKREKIKQFDTHDV